MASPLHQFEIQTIAPLYIAGYDVSFSNASLAMVLALIACTAFFMLGLRARAIVPGRFQTLTETAYQTVADLLENTAGPKSKAFLPFFLTLFFFIFFGNALGMFPFAFTFTSHIVVTLAMAAAVFFTVVITGFAKHGLHFIHLFVPSGVPMALLPLMFVLELVSFCVRPFSLAIRLFANMMAGHILVKVFAGMIVSLIVGLGALGAVVGILPFLMTVFLVAFEFFVAGLQALIFTILAAVYLRDALEMH